MEVLLPLSIFRVNLDQQGRSKGVHSKGRPANLTVYHVGDWIISIDTRTVDKRKGHPSLKMHIYDDRSTSRHPCPQNHGVLHPQQNTLNFTTDE